MNPCYAKTDAGRDEIRNATEKLSRAARNLLLVIDEKHPGSNWVQLVQGATHDDLRALVVRRLVEQKHEATEDHALRSARTLSDALAQLSYDQLYGLMTSQARDRLGLIDGFRFILRVERCANTQELHALALEFMKLVQQHQGQAVARQMRISLGATPA